jgi:hypothetical protein
MVLLHGLTEVNARHLSPLGLRGFRISAGTSLSNKQKVRRKLASHQLAFSRDPGAATLPAFRWDALGFVPPAASVNSIDVTLPSKFE